MKTIIIAIVFAVVISIQPLIAQNANDDNKLHHAVGAALGYSTGYGISYLGTYNKFKTQVTFSPYFVHRTYDEQFFYDSLWHFQSSFGISFFHMLTDNKVVNLYAYQGNHWFYDNYYQKSFDDFWGADTNVYQKKESFTVHSLGIGLEFKFLKKGSFHFAGGYAYSGNKQSLRTTGEVGLFYYLGKI